MISRCAAVFEHRGSCDRGRVGLRLKIAPRRFARPDLRRDAAPPVSSRHGKSELKHCRA